MDLGHEVAAPAELPQENNPAKKRGWLSAIFSRETAQTIFSRETLITMTAGMGISAAVKIVALPALALAGSPAIVAASLTGGLSGLAVAAYRINRERSLARQKGEAVVSWSDASVKRRLMVGAAVGLVGGGAVSWGIEHFDTIKSWGAALKEAFSSATSPAATQMAALPAPPAAPAPATLPEALPAQEFPQETAHAAAADAPPPVEEMTRSPLRALLQETELPPMAAAESVQPEVTITEPAPEPAQLVEIETAAVAEPENVTIAEAQPEAPAPELTAPFMNEPAETVVAVEAPVEDAVTETPSETTTLAQAEEPPAETPADPQPAQEPSPEPVPTAMERLSAAMGENPSALARETLQRALEGNAQAQKDMAFFLFNGREGLAVNRELAVEIYRSAASLGNTQAMVDLAYIKFHGLAGVAADPTAARTEIRELASRNPLARQLDRAWNPSSARSGMGSRLGDAARAVGRAIVPAAAAGETPALSCVWETNAAGQPTGALCDMNRAAAAMLRPGMTVTAPR